MDTPALKITETGQLRFAAIDRVPGTNTYADDIGRILTDTGETTVVLGWGNMDGTVHLLRDEAGRDAYYIRADQAIPPANPGS